MRTCYIVFDARSSRIAQALAAQSLVLGDSVLTRVWLLGPGDSCDKCPMAPECPERTVCLHLVASAGLTSRTDGEFRRFPLGARRVGEVPRTLEPLVIAGSDELAAIADRRWLLLHRIESFGAWPLGEAPEVFGVLAIFSRRPMSAGDTRAFAALAELGGAALAALAAGSATGPPRQPRGSASRSMADLQRDGILEALRHAGGKVSGPGGAAEILGMKSTTLESRIRRLGLRKPPRPSTIRT